MIVAQVAAMAGWAAQSLDIKEDYEGCSGQHSYRLVVVSLCDSANNADMEGGSGAVAGNMARIGHSIEHIPTEQLPMCGRKRLGHYRAGPGRRRKACRDGKNNNGGIDQRIDAPASDPCDPDEPAQPQHRTTRADAAAHARRIRLERLEIGRASCRERVFESV